jgi:hypothetical protein
MSDLDWATLGAVPEMLQTSHCSLTVGLDAQPGQSILIRGGTSSIGLATTVLAKRLGMTVLATTRNPERTDSLRRVGVDYPLVDDGNVAVAASPEDVWPWIAQIGQGRGGFYTYQTLENMAGCKVTNTAEILRDHQHPAVGEDIYLHPTAPPMRIEIVDPPTALVPVGSPADIGTEEGWGISTWQFIVNADPNRGSRFLTRGRYDYSPDWKSRLTLGRFPTEVISFVMSRKMMLEIKRLAERSA